MRPRPYQNAAVHSIFEYFASGKQGNPFLALPTGTGKSLIPPLFMQWAMQQWPNQRMLLLTHVKELIEQNYRTLMKLWPTAPVGIYSSGLGRKEGWAPLVFGGIASIKNAAYTLGHRDLLFIDEAHLLSPNESSMYQQVIKDLLLINPLMKIVGLSATPFRMGQGKITDGGLFTDMIFDITGVDAFNKLLDDLYLSPLIPKRVDNIIDVSDVRQLSNDFNQGQLQDSILRQNITGKALEEAYQLGMDRKCWIVFGAGIENCELITNILNEMGVPSTIVHSKMDDDTRDSRLRAFKEGHYRAIVSNNILTTGFDHPQVDCIIDLRPTTSVVLHIQKYGRGTRPYFHPSYSYEQLEEFHHRKAAIELGGKRNCIVLDFAGNTERLGPINDPRIPNKKGKSTGEVPVKLCDNCGAYNHISARFCADCQTPFVFKTKVKPTASTTEIIKRNDPKIELVEVSMMLPKIHKKIGKPDTLKVTYFQGIRPFSVYLGFESIGYPKHKSHDWWRQHVGEPIPETTAEAYSNFGLARKPKAIRVNTGGKYNEILEFEF